MKTLIPVFTLLFFASCSSMKNDIERNNKATMRLFNSLAEKNGNAFYVNSTHATFSTVWLYKDGYIEIYRLAKGKITEHQIFKSKSINSYSIPSSNEIDAEIKDCGLELDGDNFGIIAKKSIVRKQELPISIKCFSGKKYESPFLNKLAEDIFLYNLWYDVTGTGEYTTDGTGNKQYDIELFIANKLKSGDIGSAPMLSINHEIVNYDNGELLNIIKSLDIENVEVIPSKKSILLFGRKGADGYVHILTRKAFE